MTPHNEKNKTRIPSKLRGPYSGISGNYKWVIPTTIRSHPVGLVIGRTLLSQANPGNQESQPYLGELRARPASTACPPVGLPLNGPISCQVQMASVWPCCHNECSVGRPQRLNRPVSMSTAISWRLVRDGSLCVLAWIVPDSARCPSLEGKRSFLANLGGVPHVLFEE